MKTVPNKQDETNRAMAVLLCLFLAFLYKQMVWDPYFHHTLMQKSPVTGTATPATSVQPKDPADPFAEPSEESFAGESNPATAPATPHPGTPQSAPPQEASPPLGSMAPAVSNTGRYPSDAQIRDGGTVAVETDHVAIRFSLLGGRIVEYLLKDYATAVGPNQPRLNMVEHVEHAPYPLGAYSGGVDDSWTTYRLLSSQPVIRGSGENALTQLTRVTGEQSSAIILEGTLPDGRVITKTITVHGTGYFVELTVRLSAPPPDSSRVGIEWTKLITKDSPSLLDPYHTAGYVWFDGQKALRETFAKLHADRFDVVNVIWLAIADKYFMASLLSDDEPSAARVLKTGELYRARLFGSDLEKRARLFIGPKSYRVLEEAGFELKRTIDVGYTGVISVPLLSLLHLLHGFLRNYGLAIIMLTIIVKLLTYPLTASAFRQMKGMQDLAPELNRIKESGADKQQQQMDMMQLYKDRGVNPVGGCFPILLQMPVFIGLYSALMLDIELRHAPFALWVHDLAAPEKLHIAGIGIPVMVILFVISMLIQQWQTPSTMDPAQKRVMMFMPLVFGFMFANMPAGLTLYWLTNNFISIGQQAGFRREGTGHGLRLTLIVAGAVLLFCALLVWAS